MLVKGLLSAHLIWNIYKDSVLGPVSLLDKMSSHNTPAWLGIKIFLLL